MLGVSNYLHVFDLEQGLQHWTGEDLIQGGWYL